MVENIVDKVKEGMVGVSLDHSKHYFLLVSTGEIYEEGNYSVPVNRLSRLGRVNTQHLLNNYHITYGKEFPVDIDKERRLNHLGRLD